MEELLKGVEALQRCRVCKGIFNIINEPPCKHRLCNACLRNVLRSERCPVCGESVTKDNTRGIHYEVDAQNSDLQNVVGLAKAIDDNKANQKLAKDLEGEVERAREEERMAKKLLEDKERETRAAKQSAVKAEKHLEEIKDKVSERDREVERLKKDHERFKEDIVSMNAGIADDMKKAEEDKKKIEMDIKSEEQKGLDILKRREDDQKVLLSLEEKLRNVGDGDDLEAWKRELLKLEEGKAYRMELVKAAYADGVPSKKTMPNYVDLKAPSAATVVPKGYLIGKKFVLENCVVVMREYFEKEYYKGRLKLHSYAGDRHRAVVQGLLNGTVKNYHVQAVQISSRKETLEMLQKAIGEMFGDKFSQTVGIKSEDAPLVVQHLRDLVENMSDATVQSFTEPFLISNFPPNPLTGLGFANGHLVLPSYLLDEMPHAPILSTESFYLSPHFGGTVDLVEAVHRGYVNKDNWLSVAFQLIQATALLHHCGIAHTNICPSNVFVRPNAKTSNFVSVVLGDLTAARPIKSDSWEVSAKLGCFHPPECFDNGRGEILWDKVDIWGIAATIATIFVPPLFSQYILENIKSLSAHIDPKRPITEYMQGTGVNRLHIKFPDMPAEMCPLVEEMLIYDPKKRPTAESLYQHPLFDEFRISAGVPLDSLAGVKLNRDNLVAFIKKYAIAALV